MEKHGVCTGEGDDPKPSEKRAADTTKVGGDLQSRMAEAAVPGGITRKTVEDARTATRPK